MAGSKRRSPPVPQPQQEQVACDVCGTVLPLSRAFELLWVSDPPAKSVDGGNEFWRVPLAHACSYTCLAIYSARRRDKGNTLMQAVARSLLSPETHDSAEVKEAE